MASKLASSRVRSAFAVADQHALLASSIHREDDTSSASGSSWNRPALLKLPSASRSEHWAAASSGDVQLYYSPSATPQVESFRSLQTQFSHSARSPKIEVVRSEQDAFKFPLSTPQVRSSRMREEATFRAPPNTPQLAAMRSAEAAFKSSPNSVQMQMLRSQDDPFLHMSPRLGQGDDPFLHTAMDHTQGGQGLRTSLSHNPAAALCVRQQIEQFRSEPLTPTLVAIRERLESFAHDKTEQDPLAAAIAKEAEDPFARDPSFNLDSSS